MAVTRSKTGNDADAGFEPAFRVLFVCTGNTCRSPMAAVYFRHLCVERGVTAVSVQSAGVVAVGGEPMSGQAIRALAAEGLDGNGERSVPLSRDLVAWADVIVVMTAEHERRVLHVDMRTRGKVRTLMSFAGQGGDVPDPYGGTEEQYGHCLAKMKPALAALAVWIGRRIEAAPP